MLVDDLVLMFFGVCCFGSFNQHIKAIITAEEVCSLKQLGFCCLLLFYNLLLLFILYGIASVVFMLGLSDCCPIIRAAIG